MTKIHITHIFTNPSISAIIHISFFFERVTIMNSEHQSNALRGFKHSLAPIFAFLFMAGFVCLSTVLTLPEEHRTYYTALLIFGFLFSLFFLLITVPCALYGGYLSVSSICREKKYVLPILSILLDVAAVTVWGFCLRILIIGY